MNKTLWQKIYSFFGFWSYCEFTDKEKYRIFYWCCLPWVNFLESSICSKFKLKKKYN